MPTLPDFLTPKIDCVNLPTKPFDLMGELLRQPAVLIPLVSIFLFSFFLYLLIGIFSKIYIGGKKRAFITVKNYWYLFIPYLLLIIGLLLFIFPIYYLMFSGGWKMKKKTKQILNFLGYIGIFLGVLGILLAILKILGVF